MGFISRHITPLVINSLRSRHTQTFKHTDVSTQFKETRHAPACGQYAWFKNHTSNPFITCYLQKWKTIFQPWDFDISNSICL